MRVDLFESSKLIDFISKDGLPGQLIIATDGATIYTSGKAGFSRIMIKPGDFLKPCPICGTSRTDYERTLNSIQLLKCSPCDFVFANLSDQEINVVNSKYNENDIVGYQEQQTFIDTVWFRGIVKKLARTAKAGRVLDVGCGNGILLKHFLDQSWSAHGVDLSPWAKRFADEYGYTLYSCELEDAGLPSNYFDVVASTSTLEHIAQPSKLTKEVVRILKPGGIAYFAGVPNYGSLSVRLNISAFYHNIPPGHVSYFTYKSMRRLFSSPDIADNIKKLSITSYGIPELHRIYYSIQKPIRKMFARSENGSDRSDIVRSQPGSKLALKSSSRMALAKILITMSHSLGRPFHLGDKLEVIVIKR